MSVIYKLEEPYKGYFNLTKLMRPQKLFGRKDFMQKVVEITNKSATQGKFLKYDDVIVPGVGCSSATWAHPDLLPIAQRADGLSAPRRRKKKAAGKGNPRSTALPPGLSEFLEREEEQEEGYREIPIQALAPPGTTGGNPFAKPLLAQWQEKKQEGKVLLPWERKKDAPRGPPSSSSAQSPWA